MSFFSVSNNIIINFTVQLMEVGTAVEREDDIVPATATAVQEILMSTLEHSFAQTTRLMIATAHGKQ